MHEEIEVQLKPCDHDRIDEFKRIAAIAVLEAADLSQIRAKSLKNLSRWNAAGVWVSAHDEWRRLMTTGSDAEIVYAMTSTDQESNRLRQSPPYVGLIDEPTRKSLWEQIVSPRNLNGLQRNVSGDCEA